MSQNHFSNLRHYQYAHNLTGEQLAKKLLVSRTYILGVLSGKYFPSQGLQYRIRDLLSTWTPRNHNADEEQDPPHKPAVKQNAPAKALVAIKKKNKVINEITHEKSPKMASR